jgi:hypothetical protein
LGDNPVSVAVVVVGEAASVPPRYTSYPATGNEPAVEAFHANVMVLVVFTVARTLVGAAGGVSADPSQLPSSIRQLVGVTAELNRTVGLYGYVDLPGANELM